MDKYRVMQASRSSFYVEHFTTNLFGLFPKWRPLQTEGYMMMRTPYFPTAAEAEAFAGNHREFSSGPKLVNRSASTVAR